jgi:RsiW-degrading membrane proteinase PrsW (M82 family)
VLSIALALLPVSAFLLALVLLESFKLVSGGTLARAILAGALTALAVGLLHAELLDRSVLDARTLSRYLAPITEESVKLVALTLVFRRRPAGFLIDAGMLGFAVGTGFALVENLQYLGALPSRGPWFWAVRGCGTALLHGTTTAIVAITMKARRERAGAGALAGAAPGVALAVLLHAAFNHALVSPALAAAMIVTVLPPVAFLVFERSERATREWFGAGLDADLRLLNALLSADFGRTPAGRYLQELKARFPGPVVADMFCLLRLETELAIRAKGLLMARDAGFELPPLGLPRYLDELRYLQRSIGPTGLLALRPLQPVSLRQAWHQGLLEDAGARSRPRRRNRRRIGRTPRDVI